MLSYFKYYIIETQHKGTKEHCLKALWLCRCVQAWCLGVWSHKWEGVGV